LFFFNPDGIRSACGSFNSASFGRRREVLETEASVGCAGEMFMIGVVDREMFMIGVVGREMFMIGVVGRDAFEIGVRDRGV
jgi:hypothetical protein